MNNKHIEESVIPTDFDSSPKRRKIMANEIEFSELSPYAKNWLTNHKLAKKARFIKESPDWFEFAIPTETKNQFEFHTVAKSNGSWESHRVHIYALLDRQC